MTDFPTPVYVPKPSLGIISPSYVVYEEGGMYYARNGKTGDIDFSGTDKTVVQTAVINVLSPNGGVLLLKEVQIGAVTYGNSVLIIEQYQGKLTYYRNNMKLFELNDVNVTQEVFAKLLALVIDYPDYVTGTQVNPTINVSYMGKNFIMHFQFDEVRLFNVTDGDIIRAGYISPITPILGDKILRSIYTTWASPLLTIRVYVTKDDDELGIWDITYNFDTLAVTATLVKDLTVPLDCSYAIRYSHCLLENAEYYFYIPLGTGLYKIRYSDGNVTWKDLGFGEYFAEPTSKTGSKGEVNYMFLGRHLAGDPHRTLNRSTLDIHQTLTSQGGGSPRSNIGGQYESGSVKFTCLSGGGVINQANRIMFYDENLNKLGETAPFGDGTPTTDPWAIEIIGKTDTGKYFAIVHVTYDSCKWLLINSSTWLVDSYGDFGPVAGGHDDSYVYNAHPEYGDKTNKLLVDKIAKKTWVICRNEYKPSNYRNELWEIDFRSLNIIEWNLNIDETG